MPQVDFYIIAGDSGDSASVVACRLTEKAWRLGHRVYIHTDSEAEVRHLDTLLWTFREQSFVPHEPYAPEAERETPVLIGCDPEGPPGRGEVLVNLSPQVPGFYNRFARVADVVAGDGAARSAGRARFRQYRDQGNAMHTHDL